MKQGNISFSKGYINHLQTSHVILPLRLGTTESMSCKGEQPESVDSTGPLSACKHQT